MGPRTKLITNVNNKLKPTSKSDLIALKHDIAYLKANGEFYPLLKADWEAIVEAPYDVEGIAMKMGLSAGSLIRAITLNQINFGGTPVPQEQYNQLIDTFDRLDRYAESIHLDDD